MLVVKQRERGGYAFFFCEWLFGQHHTALLHTVGSARARRWAVYLGIVVVVVVQGSSTIDRSFLGGEGGGGFAWFNEARWED